MTTTATIIARLIASIACLGLGLWIVLTVPPSAFGAGAAMLAALVFVVFGALCAGDAALDLMEGPEA